MPFTPAHTAIVLPFIKSKRLSATGLVIGSIAPDFEYFFRMSTSSLYSHTIAGLFYFDLPVTLLLSWIFHQVVKGSLIDNLPAFLQTRLQPLRGVEFLHVLKLSPFIFLLSALLGSASHILWDGFTHNDGYFVNRLTFIYEGSSVPFDGVNYPLWYALQHTSTFIGIVVVVVYVFLMKRNEVNTKKPTLAYWFFVTIISTLIVLIRFGFILQSERIGNIVVSTIAAICIALILMGFVSMRGNLAKV